MEQFRRRSEKIAGRCALFALICVLFSAAPARQDVLAEARLLAVTDAEAAIELLSERIAPDLPASMAEFQAPLIELRAELLRDSGRLAPAAADAARLTDLAEALDDPALDGRAQFLRGTIQAENGNLANALERFHAARSRFEATGMQRELARTLNALGVTHNFLGDAERARQYFDAALPQARSAGDAGLELAVLGNLALIIGELEGPVAGLAAHRATLEIARRHENSTQEAYQLANICSRLVETGRLEQAEQTCPNAVQRLEVLGHARVLAGARMSVGDLHRAQGRTDEALRTYRETLELAAGAIPSVEEEVLRRLSALLVQSGDVQAGFMHFQRYMALKEQKLVAEQARRVRELELDYQVGQRDREIEMLQSGSERQADRLRRRNWMLAGLSTAFLVSAVLALFSWRALHVKSTLERELAGQNRSLQRAVETIGRMAQHDSLTGLLNRRTFLAQASREIERCRREGCALTVAMADIDHFKQLNDRHGHAFGDDVLKKTAERMQAALRNRDLVCRWGGEEFVFLLADTDADMAEKAVERIREKIAQVDVRVDGQRLPITLTFGVCEVEDQLGDAIDRADRAMYRGKHEGRDRVVVHDERAPDLQGNGAGA
ncbi:MAG: GGDEF domain-containing protein [Wenzhouxiangellaceae bacterium]|nr:GGDEF domain-containing protein [Wenzhouxiangellaceae bacterium]